MILPTRCRKKLTRTTQGYSTNKFFRTGKKCLKWISLWFTKLCLNFRGRFFFKPKFSGAVRIVRKEMFTQKYTFYGSFEANSVRFHHHWYLSSIWFFMVLTLKYKLALKPSLKLVLPSLSCYSTTVTIADPPTRAALVEHAKRAAYQAGDCWGQKSGDGYWMKAFGSHSGQYYLMWKKSVERLFNADVNKDVREDVPVQRQAYAVLYCPLHLHGWLWWYMIVIRASIYWILIIS